MARIAYAHRGHADTGLAVHPSANHGPMVGNVHYGAVMQLRIMLAALLFAQLADAATFTVGAAMHGIGLESNSFAALAYQWNGLDGVLLMKGAAILVTLGLLVLSARRFPRLFVWGAAAATSVGLLGLMTNVASLLIIG